MYPPVFAILSAATLVQLYCGNRIYPHSSAPDRVGTPYITWFTAGGAAENQLDGVPLIDAYVVTLRVWCDPDAGADPFLIGEAVRDALEPHAFMEDVPTSGRDAETKRFWLAMTFRFWTHRAALGGGSSSSSI